MTRVQRTAGDFYPTPADVVAKHLRHVAQEFVGYRGGAPRRVLEPSAGDGAYIRQLRSGLGTASIIAIEPDELRAYTCGAIPGVTVYRGTLEDFAKPATFVARERFDLIVGNPPFSHAEAHIRLSLAMLAPSGVLSFLLRLGFLGSKKRAALFRAHPPARIDVLSDRPSFSWTWTCGTKFNAGCGYKFTTAPGIHVDHCPNPACERPMTSGAFASTKTDASEYAFFSWREGYTGPTVLGHL